ncbi:YbfB/YjiJ family MFS transporter [Amphritea pacifica]|uniref:YbfB/YjiJ family MFS transporter n=1 Tax=Amphritea pacifica TaxID=2811233 RepID=A0ABS2W2U0_9GAMM|nr:YbfB/YjiJ family MFS transporter [Amphritea pacifica]MBN0985931.1 YbfB/YjiJ family MFS transporter [Amphritea pacifica]MBN1008236.1 YbfB/YjiJ family MFS transporter [Amphritea pacifica]
MSEISKFRMLLTCVLGVVATIGIARFAYTPMIPEMVRGVGLSESVAGYLAAANYAGYLSGALLISFIHSLALKARLYKVGLLTAVLTSMAMALTTSEPVWYLLRYLSGLSSSAGMLLGGGLLMHWLMKRNHKAELGIFFSGLGIGIVITALLAVLIKDIFTWEQQWLIYGSATLLLILPVWLWLPDFSAEQSLPKHHTRQIPMPSGFMPVLQLAYFCAGAGYVISATFLITIAESIDALAGQGWMIWLVAGLSCAPASALWDKVINMTGQWQALFAAYLLNALSILILLLSHELIAVIISALIYGASFIGIVAMMLSMVGRLFPDNPSRPMSRLTFSYGIAQVIAPAIVGLMAEYYGNFNNGLILTLIVMLGGSVALLIAQRIEQQAELSAGISNSV